MLNGIKIENVESYKRLGLIYDFGLTFNYHLDYIINKSNRILEY